MTFGDPIIYDCPSCSKPMQMTTYNSYTVRHSDVFSDGYSTGRPHFTPDLAKCPSCRALFFRHNVKGKTEMDYRKARKAKNKIKDIKDPERAYFIKALKQGIAKNRKEEKQIREYLWRDLNNETRHGGEEPGGTDGKIYRDNCAALLPLTEKTLKEMQLKKNSKKYDDDDRDNCLIMIAELNRNLGNFDECAKLISQLHDTWGWLKKQYTWECKAKNPRTFILLGKHLMELKKGKTARGEDYYERGCLYLKRGKPKEALADFIKGEELGLREYEYSDLLIERGGLYVHEFKEYEKAIADFTKAISLAEYDRQKEEALHGRSAAHTATGDFAAALADIQAAIESDDTRLAYYHTRQKIHEALGNTEAAEWDGFKAGLLWGFRSGKCENLASFCETGARYDISQNAKGILTIRIQGKDGEPVEAEILYSGGENALFRRRPCQFIKLDAIPEDLRNALLKSGEVVIAEDTAREYTVKTRPVIEPLDTLQAIVTDGYPFFTGLRARLYAHKDKPIREVIGKEDWTTLACVLAREEDYAQLERYAAEGLPLDEISPEHYRPFQPTPFYYITLNFIWGLMKDPVKMLRWLIGRGADPNKTGGDSCTPLGNQCFPGGNRDIMKALLEAGANPNLETYLNHGHHLPLALIATVAGYDSNPSMTAKDKKKIETNFTPADIENLKKLAALLREYGAKETLEELGTETHQGRPIAPRPTRVLSSDEIDQLISAINEEDKTEQIPDEKTFPICEEWVEIQEWKFARDKDCTTLVIPAGVVRIGKCAFAHCKNLRKIDIGRNVSEIGKYAFRKDNRPGDMADITEVINHSVEPQTINARHFHNNNLAKATLRVPAESVGAYTEAEGWKEFGSIVAMEEAARLAGAGDAANHTMDWPPYVPASVHIWLGSFDSKEDLDEYADNSEYEWEYYGHLLGEDNFDEPPEEYGIGCGFCWDNGLQYLDAADITDDLVWDFYEQEMPLSDILSEFLDGLPVDIEEILEACKKKYPELKKANSAIAVFGWKSKTKDFKKAKSRLEYLGEFDLTEPEQDDDGRYDAWV